MYDFMDRNKQANKNFSLSKIECLANKGVMSVELIELNGKTNEDIPVRLRGVRSVVGSRGKGSSLVLKTLSSTGSISEIQLAKPAFIECNDETLTIYGAGKRTPNAKERMLLNEWQKIQTEFLTENPYSDCYSKKLDFFKESEFPYLSGIERISGKDCRFDGEYVHDSNTRGDVISVYKVYIDHEDVEASDNTLKCGYALAFDVMCFGKQRKRYYSGNKVMRRHKSHAVYSDKDIKRYSSVRRAELAYEMLRESHENIPSSCEIVELSVGKTGGKTVKRIGSEQ